MVIIIIHIFVLNVFIFEASHEQCDVAQFSQVNLSSCFPSGY